MREGQRRGTEGAGAEASSRLAIGVGPVLAYNGVRLSGSILVALIASAQIFEAERRRSFRLRRRGTP